MIRSRPRCYPEAAWHVKACAAFAWFAFAGAILGLLIGCSVPPEAIQQASESALHNERESQAMDGTGVVSFAEYAALAEANAYAWWVQHHLLTGDMPPAWVVARAKAGDSWCGCGEGE